MGAIIPIVEGDGEERAVPLLLRRLQYECQRWDLQIAPPKNAHGRDNLLRSGGLERFLSYAWLEPECAAVLVLLDADEDCPKEIAPQLAERARALNPPCPVAIVLAKCEYEAWFLASLETIAGQNLKGRAGLPAGVHFEGDVEAIRGVKDWISRKMLPGRIYKETFDQAPMTALMDFSLARARSRSFRRLEHAFQELVEVVDKGEKCVTPINRNEEEKCRKKPNSPQRSS